MTFIVKTHILVGVLLCCCTTIKCNKVLLISMDGFRWDYIQNVSTPNFDAFAAKGTRADYINNTFVTKTFPCHYTIATVFNETFGMSTEDNKWWNGGEPLWVTVQKYGFRSAVYFWPGSDAEGLSPDIFEPYNEPIPFKTRVDTVVQWLSNATFNIDFAMLYFHEPDNTGHAYGPNSQQVRDKVKEMDGILGYIVQKFDEAGLWDNVNVLLTSDHGMTEVDYSSRHIDLSTYIDMNSIDRVPVDGPTANILPKANMVDEIFRNLTGIKHLTVYKKEDIPDHWHYKNNRRILPVLAVADEGWLIVKIVYNKRKNNHLNICSVQATASRPMTSPGTGLLLLMATLLVCLIVNAYDMDVLKKRSIFRRQRPRQMRHRLDFLRRNQLTDMGNLDNTSDWVRSYIPEIPREEDVDCSIEVEVVEVIGGRCVRLGGARQMAVCQSGMYLDVQSQECQHIIAAREMNELRQQLETAMENRASEPENGVTQPALDSE